jgi:hypothetical protein
VGETLLLLAAGKILPAGKVPKAPQAPLLGSGDGVTDGAVFTKKLSGHGCSPSPLFSIIASQNRIVQRSHHRKRWKKGFYFRRDRNFLGL